MFYKHASANIKGTLLLHSQNLFQLHLENVLIDELQVVWLYNSQNAIVNFFYSFCFLNYEMSFERIWKKEIKINDFINLIE